ncbi:MAG TPA: ABC transporter ATP-binding protein [Kineosporiaceae bacterium]|nr:ABC transporter ATP-binding protein [Kineosporiaceae bacterium]
MPDAPHEWAVDVRGLTKFFGDVVAVRDLSFSVVPGRVTGFLGPNGAGKTTTLRIMLGLVRATRGTATIGGRRYVDLPSPQTTVGAVLEASSFHPGRTARDSLRVAARPSGIADERIEELLALVDLTPAAGRRVGEFSLGMRQRLGLAQALLGDPGVLILDEPANGLDPEGIAWLRGFLRSLAAQGRTVLISSHVLSEVQQTVDDVVIITRGQLVRSGRLEELSGAGSVRAVTPDAAGLVVALTAAGIEARAPLPEEVLARGTTPAAVGHTAFTAGIELHGLGPAASDLETIFLRLVEDRETAATPTSAPPPTAPPSEPVPAVQGAPAASPSATPDSPAASPSATPDSPAASPSATPYSPSASPSAPAGPRSTEGGA